MESFGGRRGAAGGATVARALHVDGARGPANGAPLLPNSGRRLAAAVIAARGAPRGAAAGAALCRQVAPEFTRLIPFAAIRVENGDDGVIKHCPETLLIEIVPAGGHSIARVPQTVGFLEVVWEFF